MRGVLLSSIVLCACAPAGEGKTGPMGEAGAMGDMGAPGAMGPGQLVKEVLGSGQLVVGAQTTTFALVPGLKLTVDVPDGLVINAHSDGGVQCTGTGNAFSAIDVALFVDGLESTAARRIVAANTAGLAQVIVNWSLSRTFTGLAPGSHTIEVRAVTAGGGGADANVSSGGAPQLQGVLTVMLLQPAP